MSMLLQHGISLQADTRPDAVALVSGATRVTYGELDEVTNRLAHLLADAGCERGDRVGLLMPKVPAAILGMIATLKADAIYVPLDTASPPARVARMLQASGCRVILATASARRALEEALALAQLASPPVIGWLDSSGAPASSASSFTMDDVQAYPASAPSCSNSDTDIAHILFTSGSTGVPKGVMITHRNVLAFLRWARAYFGIASTDRISQHPPLHFDLSTFDIYGTLWSGAELHLVPPEVNLLPHKLAQFIRDSRLTQWFSVPSVLNFLAKYDAVQANDFPSLRRVLWCGEAIPTPTVIYWMQRLPHVRFTNLYGPTEATIASSYYTLSACPTDKRAPIPIGVACDGEELLVLDEHLQPLPEAAIGDLYIRGAGLSPGYWQDADKTRSAFVPYPQSSDPADRIYRTGDLARRTADGLFHFIGRADTQVKSRGYRIELGEIETALACVAELRESAIVAIPSEGFEGSLICCAYAVAPDAQTSPMHIREALAEQVPMYMLPSRWLSYDVLPKNANGKIDRPCLRNDFLRQEANAAGASSTPVRDPIAADEPRLSSAAAGH
jgi:amino acid adenylation domain-containing protein